MQKPIVNNPWVDLNNTVQSLVPNGTISVSASTVYTLTLNANTVNVEIAPVSILSAPVYFKFKTGSDTSNASATNYDDFLSPYKTAVQRGKATSTTDITIFSTVALDLLVVQR